jgi:hypothetical protein
MSTYRVKTGHGAALVDLVALSPQPRSEGVMATQRTHAASGLVYEQALFVRLEWNVLGDAADYLAVLTAFGLASASQANVTIYARNQRYAWQRYNGVSVLPEVGRDVTWDRSFPRGISVIVRDLVAL